MSARWNRRHWLGAALALSLLATGWLGASENADTGIAVSAPAAPRAADAAVRSPSPPVREPQLQLTPLRRQPGAVGGADLFAAKSWQVPVAAARPENPPVVVESAPALPYVYLGKMIYDGKTTVFLTRQDRNYDVREGDLLDASYRVDTIKGALMTLTFLPLNTQQTIHIGDPP